jgi:hypothetical protein
MNWKVLRITLIVFVLSFCAIHFSCNGGNYNAGNGGGGGGGGDGASCGNEKCESGESVSNCPQDCPGLCGDSICNTDFENATTCPHDCNAGASCGNGACDSGESVSNCPQDCHGTCGDSICNTHFENATTCPQDCHSSAVCGNGTCETGESATNCPKDCPGTCGDSICNVNFENASNCPQDCPNNFKACSSSAMPNYHVQITTIDPSQPNGYALIPDLHLLNGCTSAIIPPTALCLWVEGTDGQRADSDVVWLGVQSLFTSFTLNGQNYPIPAYFPYQPNIGAGYLVSLSDSCPNLVPIVIGYDTDGDGFNDNVDNCKLIANPDQAANASNPIGAGGIRVGDACMGFDNDNDGIPNVIDP